MTPHAKLLKDICAYLVSIKAWYVRPNSHGYGRRGIPDVIACVDGKFLAIEAKVKPDKADAWQQREIHAIHAAGGSAIVVYDVAAVKLLCEAMKPDPLVEAQASRIIDHLMSDR